MTHIRNGSERFAVVPRHVFDAGLSHGAFRLYAALALHANREGVCWPSQETLARMLCVSERSVQYYLKELKGNGLVACEYRRGVPLYILSGEHEDPQDFAPLHRLDPQDFAPQPRNTLRPRSAIHCDQNNTKEHKIEEHNKQDLSRERDLVMPAKFCGSGKCTNNGNGHRNIDMTDFENKLADFLEVYPPPEGGMPSRKIVERAFHRVFYDGANLGDVVDGARRYAAFLREHSDRPVQDPVRWLERREWEREWKAPQARKPKRSPVYDRATMLAAQKWQAGYRWRECVDEAREQLLKEGEHPPELIYAPFGSYGIIHEQEVTKNGHH